MKALVYSKTGNKKGEIVLNPEIFAARINQRLIELVRNAYSANLRHGTADTKTRKEVRGGGKKPWRQKGTGRARASSIRSPIWRGGGTVFGPHPRSYYVNMSQNMRRQALVSALSLRGEQKNVFVLEDAQMASAKTKEWADVVKALPLDGKRALCVVKEIDQNLQRACRNLESLVRVRRARDLNAYDVLQREKIVIEQDAISVIENRILENPSAAVVEGEAAEAKKPAAKKAVKKTSAKPAAAKSKSAPKKKG
jgi:large subunit ribosomal protein L4